MILGLARSKDFELELLNFVIELSSSEPEQKYSESRLLILFDKSRAKLIKKCHFLADDKNKSLQYFSFCISP